MAGLVVVAEEAHAGGAAGLVADQPVLTPADRFDPHGAKRRNGRIPEMRRDAEPVAAEQMGEQVRAVQVHGGERFQVRKPTRPFQDRDGRRVVAVSREPNGFPEIELPLVLLIGVGMQSRGAAEPEVL